MSVAVSSVAKMLMSKDFEKAKLGKITDEEARQALEEDY